MTKKRAITSGYICLLIVFVGFICELLLPDIKPSSFRFPLNSLLMGAMLLSLLMMYTQFRNSRLTRIMLTKSMGVAIIVSYATLVCTISLIPQDGFLQRIEDDSILREMGLYTITKSYPFIFISIMMQISLGLVVLKHITKSSRRSILLWSVHLGLWLIITAGMVGAGDYCEQRVSIREGEEIGMAMQEDGKMCSLGFTIRLDKMEIEYYPQGSAKSIISTITVIDEAKRTSTPISVNAPLRMGSYYIYQSGFELSKSGEYKSTSILKIVYDPYIWMWYLGLMLLIFCAGVMIFLNVEQGLNQEEGDKNGVE